VEILVTILLNQNSLAISKKIEIESVKVPKIQKIKKKKKKKKLI